MERGEETTGRSQAIILRWHDTGSGDPGTMQSQWSHGGENMIWIAERAGVFRSYDPHVFVLDGCEIIREKIDSGGVLGGSGYPYSDHYVISQPHGCAVHQDVQIIWPLLYREAGRKI